MTRIDMTTREWHDLIKPVLPHVIADKDFPELDVVRLEAGARTLYAVATDRYTLAAERWPLDARNRPSPDEAGQVVHLDAGEAAASLRLFTFSKDDDPPLQVAIDPAPVQIRAAGQPRSVDRLAVTITQAGDGTRLVLHDQRDPGRDPLAAWRKNLHAVLSREGGRTLDGLDLHAAMMARWAKAARKGERLSMYTGPEPGDPLLITVEEHFAGLWAVPQYLDGPAKTLAGLPWHDELDGGGGTIDMETGKRLDDGGTLL